VLFIAHDPERVLRELFVAMVHRGEQSLEPFPGKYSIDQLDAQVCLKYPVAMQFQEAFEVGRSRVGRVQLAEGRRDEQDILGHKGAPW
jgi:hypothetical protein